MTPLGKSLVFYLKYWAEMERLVPAGDSGELGAIKDLPEPDRVLPMVRAIGEAADRAAVEFLDACADAMVKPLRTLGDCRRLGGPVRKNWETKAEVALPSRKGRLRVGLLIQGDTRVLVPWVRSRGGRRVADKVRQLLRPGITGGVVELPQKARVALEGILLIPEKHEGFDVDREPIVRRVGELFAELTREKLEAILALQAPAEEPS
jgi:hypothetical protein